MTELNKQIHDILINSWDPIGVGSHKEAQDEYDSYIPHIAKYLIEGADEYKIAGHLYNLETRSMGLPGDKGRCEIAARMLVALNRSS